jgi:regulator of protease activity HflC (stomatin/prohibitin superfamily)
MKSLVFAARIVVLLGLAGWLLPSLMATTVRPGDVAVRQNNFSGVSERDITPGFAMRLPGVHKIHVLPSRYSFLSYSSEAEGAGGSLQIRTRDNNIVLLDVSVPYRIIPGQAFEVVKAGNHIADGSGTFRYQRLAQETTVSVLREQLADLTSSEFYSTERRLEVADRALKMLNESLAPLHVEAERVLIRAVTFRPEYEKQLQQIQLNEQNKLLDGAREKVAKEQQELDKFTQATAALAASRQQDWIKRQALLDRAYELGFVELPVVEGGEDATAGSVRRALAALDDAQRAALVTRAAGLLDKPEAEITDEYLLGIKNIQAETLEYDRRVRSEADGLAARLEAEGRAELAKVRGEYESQLNALLGSSAGRAYVAYEAAGKITFHERLVFQSDDGIPSVLRLRAFAEQFMGNR